MTKVNPAVSARFTVIRHGRDYTVWDAESGQLLVHGAKWNEEAARQVAAALNARPYQTEQWDWQPWKA